MQGATSTLKLNTKQDFINNYAVRVANREEDPLQDYRMIYENRFSWFDVMDEIEEQVEDPITNEMITVTKQVPRIVTKEEDAVIDDTHRIVNSGSNEEPVIVQQELRVDYVGSFMALKGFTENELEEILGI